MQNFVSYALSIGALELLPDGRQLKSGRISPYFFNSGLFKTGASLAMLARAYAKAAAPTNAEVLFGPAYKGIPLSAATAVMMAEHYGKDVEYAFNRKEAKDHGEGGTIVGASLKNKKVTILDDVMTTGDSVAEACSIIREAGGIPVACVIGFNRQERGKDGSLSAVEEFEMKEQIPVYAAATLSDLIFELQEFGAVIPGGMEVLPKILAYRDQYGI